MKNLIIKTLVVAGMTIFLASIASAQNVQLDKKGNPKVCPAKNVEKLRAVKAQEATPIIGRPLIHKPVRRKFAPAIQRKELLDIPLKK